jgi:hypothetical protein
MVAEEKSRYLQGISKLGQKDGFGLSWMVSRGDESGIGETSKTAESFS